MFQPLKGLRVIDLTQVLAGPYATYQLALLGAEVIKVENPDGGDWTRAGRSLPGHENQGLGASFLTQNANKKSIAIDLKQPAGLALLKQLVASADIFVENYRPGTAAKLGLSFDNIKALNKKIIYCSMSAYGQDGPLSHRPAYDHVVQGMCGIMQSTGTAQTTPNKVGSPYIDYVTGLNGAFAMTNAVHQVRLTGEAVRIDVAMLDSAMLLMASMLTQSLSLGMEHHANGNAAFSGSPSSGAFATSSGTLMIAANNERQFASLCKGLDRTDILQDARWSTAQARSENADSLRDEIAARILGNTAAHWEAKLDKELVPAARVRGITEVLNEDHLQARGLMVGMAMEGSEVAAFVPTLGFKADGEVTAPHRAPVRLGADTDAVLGELGMSASQISELKLAGAIK
jgi:crotonobetainyl-CoA:carnitine CoA-transferase CaiB-like acyl-CoA transferase